MCNAFYCSLFFIISHYFSPFLIHFYRNLCICLFPIFSCCLVHPYTLYPVQRQTCCMGSLFFTLTIYSLVSLAHGSIICVILTPKKCVVYENCNEILRLFFGIVINSKNCSLDNVKSARIGWGEYIGGACWVGRRRSGVLRTLPHWYDGVVRGAACMSLLID